MFMSGWNGQFNARLQRLEKKAAEGGGGGGVLAVHNVDGTLDKTWKEIVNAMASGGGDASSCF